MSETKKENLETEQKKKSKDQLIDEVQTESRQKLQKVIDFIKKILTEGSGNILIVKVLLASLLLAIFPYFFPMISMIILQLFILLGFMSFSDLKSIQKHNHEAELDELLKDKDTEEKKEKEE